MRNTTRGQSTVEYVVVTAVVIAALLATTIYMKRGKMGDLGRATDQIGSQFNPHQQASQYEIASMNARQELQVTSGARESIILPGTIEAQTRRGAERMTQSRQKCEQLFFQPGAGGVGDLECPAPVAPPIPGDAPVPDPI